MATDHGETCRAVEYRSAREQGHGFFAGVDEIGIDGIGSRVRAETQQTILAVEGDLDSGRDTV